MNEALKAKLKEESDAHSLCSEIFDMAKHRRISIPVLIEAMIIRYGYEEVERAIVAEREANHFYNPF